MHCQVCSSIDKSTSLTQCLKFDLEISTAQLPVTFVPDGPGHYQCRIVLTAPADVRVFQIEVTVNPDGSDIELEFTSPTHEFVTQNIPVVRSARMSFDFFAIPL